MKIYYDNIIMLAVHRSIKINPKDKLMVLQKDEEN